MKYLSNISVIFSLFLFLQPSYSHAEAGDINLMGGTTAGGPIKIMAGKTLKLGKSSNISKQSITLNAGEEFVGNGLLEAPEIEIATKKFSFTGTIRCTGTCTVNAKIPFDQNMFKREGNGTFIIKPEQSTFDQYIKAQDLVKDGICFRDGNGVKQDYKKAAECFTAAAASGDIVALCALGHCYEKGNGVDKNLKKAFELYSQAANLGDPFAIVTLGYYYRDGIGVAKNPNKAFELFKKAVDMENASLSDKSYAQLALAQCYNYGLGVTKNLITALSYYNNAAINEETSEYRDILKEQRECISELLKNTQLNTDKPKMMI